MWHSREQKGSERTCRDFKGSVGICREEFRILNTGFGGGLLMVAAIMVRERKNQFK
jgi:hypothetical protein